MEELIDLNTFGNDRAAIAMAEELNKFDNWKFKKTYARTVQNFETHLVNLMQTKMDKHSKAYFLEQVMPNVIKSFNFIRENYREDENIFNINFACGKAVGHFRYKIANFRRLIIKD